MNRSLIPVLLISITIFGCSSTANIPEQTRMPKPPSRTESDSVFAAVDSCAKGKYDQAVTILEHVLKVNPDNIDALREISSALWNQKKLTRCMEYARRGSEYESPYIAEFYIIRAHVLDYMGNPEEAETFYHEAFRLEPSNYDFYYQAGLTKYLINKFDDADIYLSQAVKLNPRYSLGYFALADLNLAKREKMRSYLLDYKFLLLETDTIRAKTGLNMMNFIREISVNKVLEEMKLDGINIESPYYTSEMEFKIAQSAKNEEKKRDIIFILSEFEAVLSAIKKSPFPEKDIDAYLFSYFSKLKDSGNTEAFIYYAHQLSGLPGVSEWIKNNPAKIEALLVWDKDYNYAFKKLNGN